jgi:hypothetical protein
VPELKLIVEDKREPIDIFIWIFIVHAPFNAFIPGTLLVILLAVGSQSLRNR